MPELVADQLAAFRHEDIAEINVGRPQRDVADPHPVQFEMRS